jgi:pre-mRNA-splicing helicase BRR2
VFDDEEQDVDSEAEYVKDQEEDDDEDMAERGDDEDGDAMDIDQDYDVITSGKKSQKTKSSGIYFLPLIVEPGLNPHDIDAFWIQRSLAQAFPDAQEAQNIASSVLDILASPAPLGACENSLMELFEYGHPDLVRLFTSNRRVIAWCVKLASAASLDETKAVQDEMREAGDGDILSALGIARARKIDRRGVVEDAMEIEQQEEKEKKEAEAKTVLVPRSTIDLESISFAQGGHLMSNKKCRLPEGSFKKTGKGWEEVHVPVPSPPDTSGEKIVRVDELPAWAQHGFSGNKSLNRIQSKVYPYAFKKDENMLLCAPTGAGKVLFEGLIL